MKRIFTIILMMCMLSTYAQEDSTQVYKKRILENTEIDLLTSYYTQDGDNAAVTGGIGTEKTDITPTFVISISLNDDDVLTIDAGISAYTSASSSNLDPFDKSGASAGGDDDDDEGGISNPTEIKGSPWVASSGASKSNVWSSFSVSYNHSSDD